MTDKNKKLTKKQQRIIDNIKDALDTDYKVMADYHAEKNYDMVSHCQTSISNELSGICSYLIYSDGKSWDAVKDLINEMKSAHELHHSYAFECLED